MRRHPKAALAIAMLLCFLAIPSAAAADTLPTVFGETASEIGVTTVKISGEVNPNGTAGDGKTTWRLQYSPAGQGAWTTVNEAAIETPASEEANPVTVEAVFGFGGELTPGKTYEFRLQAENGAGQVETPAAPYPHFTMDSATAPALVAEAASAESITSAHLKGTVDPEGGNVNPFGPEAMPIFWELQTSTDGSSWTTRVEGVIAGAEAEGPAPITVEGNATGLAAETGYQVRLHAYSTNFISFNIEADSSGPNPTFSTDPATAPTLTFDPPSAVTSDSEHLAGTVDPEGGNVDALQGTLTVRWELQINPEGAGWKTVGSGELTGAAAEGTDPVNVSADATELVPGTDYKARLLVSYAGLQKSSSEEPFTTESIGPGISRETLWEPTSTSIQLNAKVNAHNSALTDCHFEYGTTTGYGQSAPCEAPFRDGTYVAPADNSNQVVSARISGLQPATEYHFRLVATNGTGEALGDDRSFTSLAAPAAESCPNQTRRDEQHSDHLSRCRAWEMVSPLAKGNGDIVADSMTTVSSRDGDAVAYTSRNQFADAVGSGVSGQTTYLARRGPTGWSTNATTPLGRPDALQTFFAATKLQVYSEDLRRAVLWGYDLPGGGGTPNRNGIFGEETATRELQPLTISQQDPPVAFDFIDALAWGISADAQHVAFVTSTPHLPVVKQAQESGEQNAGAINVYQSDEGVLSLVGVLPDGSLPPEGSAVFPQDYFGGRSQEYRAAMSRDGSRQLFLASPVLGGHPQLYQRVDGSRTVWISEPEGSDLSEPRRVSLQGASADGRSVFFVTASRLLDADENDGPDLYRYTDSADPEEDDNLTLISHSGNLHANPMVSVPLIGFSEDVEIVYYQTTEDQLVVWDHGSARVITRAVTASGTVNSNLGLTYAQPGYGRISPDGNYMAFIANDAGDTVHGPLGNVTKKHFEMFLYDYENDTVRCLSCPAGAAAFDARITPGASDSSSPTAGNPSIANIAYRPNFLSDSGEAFFSTGEALVPEDTNGVFDTYAYDPATGRLSLLTSGKGKLPSVFANASPSGDDVFLLSRYRLTAGDTDEFVDLYDARVDGGFAEAPPPKAVPCAGEACQGGAPSSPAMPSVASGVRSRGNLHRRSRCTKAKHRAGKCKGQKKHRKHQRATNANRRTAK